MKHKIFTIYDQAADAYLSPFFIHEEAMATRSFTICVNDPDHAFSKTPGDYTLFNIGAFDDEIALITTNKTPIKVCNGLEVQNLVQSTDEIPIKLEALQ